MRKKQKRFFIISMLALMLAVVSLQSAQNVSASTYYDSYSTVTNDMKNTIHNLISKQSFSLISNQTAIGYADHFMFQSNWKVGNNFPYSNDGSDAGTISDGTYTYNVGSTKGCYAYCRFLQYVFFNGKSDTNTRMYSDSSTVTADGIKNLLKTNGQAGEHLRIDNYHSLTFLGANNNGFYALSYEGGPIRLVYFTWSNFAAKYKGYRVWLYNVDTTVNSENTSSGSGSTTADTTAPTISRASVTDISNEGYTVSCTVSDDVEVYMVAFNTMATNHQMWEYLDVNAATKLLQYRVNTKDYDYVDGNYTTEIYVYDKSNNRSVYQFSKVYIDRTAPVISNYRVTDLSETGYTVLCDVTDDVSLYCVQFPTWTEYNGQDDIDTDWVTGTKSRGTLVSGNTYSFRVNISDHNNELGTYITHIYAFDSQGNATAVGVSANVQKEETSTEKQTLTLQGIDGNTYDVSDMKEDVVALFFGRTSCYNTNTMIAKAEELLNRGTSIKIVLMDVDETDSGMQNFAASHPNVLVAHKDGGYGTLMFQLLKEQGISTGSSVTLPGTILLNKERVISYASTGLDTSSLETAIGKLTTVPKAKTTETGKTGNAGTGTGTGTNQTSSTGQTAVSAGNTSSNGNSAVSAGAGVSGSAASTSESTGAGASESAAGASESAGSDGATATTYSSKIHAVSKKLAAGIKTTLNVTGDLKSQSDNLVWKSSNTKYATVSAQGVVTTKKAGIGKTVTITAKSTDGSGQKATYKFKIMKGTVQKVTAKASKTVKAGKSVTVKTTVKATSGANKKLSFTSSNKKYATVSSKGKVTTYKAGKGKTVKITVAATDGSGKKTTVKIKIK
jgi:hypothetical protein